MLPYMVLYLPCMVQLPCTVPGAHSYHLQVNGATEWWWCRVVR